MASSFFLSRVALAWLGPSCEAARASLSPCTAMHAACTRHLPVSSACCLRMASYTPMKCMAIRCCSTIYPRVCKQFKSSAQWLKTVAGPASCSPRLSLESMSLHINTPLLHSRILSSCLDSSTQVSFNKCPNALVFSPIAYRSGPRWTRYSLLGPSS